MDWHNDVAAELPAPNEDEPASLRRDILDELSDHLACAVHRERIHEPDEDIVRRNILNRFGNPATIARRLWFDAMKGKLMLQKLTAAFAATAALAAIAICLVLWSAVSAATSAFELAVEQSRKDRERSDKANAAMLARLETLAAESKKNDSATLEWNPLKIRLLRGAEGDRPASKYSVTLSGQPYKGGEKQEIYKQSDANGSVDFGRVRPGKYAVRVQTPWDSSLSTTIHVKPGSNVEQTVRCPDTEIVETRVAVAADLPDDLAKRKCRIVALVRGPRQPFNRHSWSLPQNSNGSYYEFTATEPTRYLNGWNAQFIQNPGNELLVHRFNQRRNDYLTKDPTSPWRTGEYHIEFIAIVMPDERSNERARTVGSRVRQRWLRFSHIVSAISYAGDHFFQGHCIKEDQPSTFTPQAGKENIWKITLPPKLLADARARLKKYDALSQPRKDEPKKKKPARPPAQKMSSASTASAQTS